MTEKILPLILLGLTCVATHAQRPDTVFLEELTSTEVRNLLDDGYTTVIIPTAGTEQNGPHMVLGKHKYRINYGSEKIARTLGKTLVAPTMTYVPEGNIDPPSGHMQFAGTLSIPEDVFEKVLEYTARSLRKHGFKDILMIGDSGGNQEGMKKVSVALSEEWNRSGVKVHYVSDWYSVGVDRFVSWLKKSGYTEEQIGDHAGLVDTALLLAVAPEHVRSNAQPGKGFDVDGVSGDPTLATKELGNKGMEFIVEASLKQISILMDRRAPSTTKEVEQDGARRPATAPDSKSEGKEKPKPESEGRSQ
jgi:creatinine amidohydrolase/Fe(II)-dependent formamide hydrolase-like protein